MRTVAVVLAGGSGSRLGASVPKQLLALGGATLLEHCVAAFDRAPGIDQVLVVVPAELVDQTRAELSNVAKLAAVIAGGAARTDSTRAAIDWLNAGLTPGGAADCNVLFHDAARPLIDQRTISACLTALGKWLAVGVVVPTADTIVEVADDKLQRVLPRDSLARCQTPQGFRLSVIASAYRLAAADPDFAAIPATDDCGVVLRYRPDVQVAAVTGSERNLKITYAADLAVAEALLRLGEPGD